LINRCQSRCCKFCKANYSWDKTPVTDAPDARCYHTAVWTGNNMVVWGGVTVTGLTSTGGIYYNSELEGIEEGNLQVTKEYNIEVSPNPFIGKTFIRYSLPENHDLSQHIGIYDISGRLTQQLEIQRISPQVISFGDELKAGIYFLKFKGYVPVKIIKLE
ncbi:MAG: T9SS type A sorting domain-containing protein, partial [bacterium]|nr:T9SS type A sorting domain-containing protein [bacterium]